MAITFSNDGAEATPNAAPIDDAVDPGAVKDFTLSAKFRRNRTIGLSPEGTQYLDDFKALNRDGNTQFRIEPVSGAGIEAMLVVHPNGEQAVLVGFAETASKSYVDTPEPAILLLQSVTTQVGLRNIKIVNAIIISRDDYVRATQLYQNICDVLDVATDAPEAQIKLGHFAGYDIRVGTNIAEAEDYIRKTSPHSVPPRMNVAAIFKIVKRTKDNTEKQEEPTTIAVVTGYTDFIQAGGVSVGIQQVIPKFKPLFHMEMFSHLPDPALISLVLPTMVELFCVKWGWLAQFDMYDVDKINIGNLIPGDPSGAPWHIADRQERNRFLGQYFEPVATPCLDVMAGKAQIPLVKFLGSDDKYIDALRARIANFLEVDIAKIPSPVRKTEAVNDFVGVIRQDQTFDSRYIDYLWVAKKNGNVDRSRLWMAYYPDSRVRGKEMSLMFPSAWEPLYINILKMISAEFINAVSDILDEKKVKFTFENQGQQQFGMQAFSSVTDFGSQLAMKETGKIVGGSGGRYRFEL